MRSTILIVTNGLNQGGPGRRLINILEQLNYEQYDVSLLILNEANQFYRSSLPTEVNILSGNRRSIVHVMIGKLLLHAILHIIKDKSYSSQLMQYVNARFFQKKILSSYDCAIANNELGATYYVAEKVQAIRKICFFSTDYVYMNFRPSFDRKFYKQYQHINLNSFATAESFKSVFREFAPRISVIKNLLDMTTIRKKALEHQAEISPNFEGITVTSSSRLRFEKGIDRAILACRAALDRGLRVRWFVLGEGDHQAQIEAMIAEYHLQHHFFLLGRKENPFPYIAASDIFALPSLYEGCPNVIKEALTLGVPVIVTKYKSAHETIQHGENGIIAENTTDAFIAAFLELCEDKHRLELLTAGAKSFDFDNEKWLQLLLQQINS